MPDDYIVKPVAKALQTLIVLGDASRDLSLAEVCGRVGLPKTTVFRYLQTLVACGFVNHDAETDRYGLGLRLWSLGQRVETTSRLRDVALPAMEDLRDRFDETVNLGLLDGTEIVYMEMAESRRALRMQARLGGRDPVYSTALGRAMLAFHAEDAWATHLPSRLTARTPHTVSSLPALRRELAATRARGYAVDDRENEEDARCIGAPILNTRGDVVAAISVSAPASRLDETRQGEVAAAVVDSARQIAWRLGYGEPASTPSPRAK